MMKNFSIQRNALWIVTIFVCIYIVYFTVASFMRYDNFYTGRFDLGNMDQAVWNTIHGRIFQTTDAPSTENISRLAYHADVILVLLAPFYLIWEDARMLLFIQTVVMACGAYFVYFIARYYLKNETVSILFAFCYLMYPSLQFVNLYDFHAVSMATTFLLASYYFLLRKNLILFILFSILSGLTKEQVWIPVTLLGFYFALQSTFMKDIEPEKKRLFQISGLLLGIGSLLIFYLLIWHVIPGLRMGQEHFALEYYKDLGESPSGIVRNVLFSPQKVVSAVFEEERMTYLKQLFLPLGYLSLVSPQFLIFSGADFLINIMSSNKQLHQIFYQYTAVITPFLFISAIFSVSFIRRVLPFIPVHYFGFLIVFSTLYSAHAFGPLPGARYENVDMFTKPLKNKNEINKALEKIPQDAKVLATNEAGSHLSQREYIFVFPEGFEKAEYIALLGRNDSFGYSKEDQINYKKFLLESPLYETLTELDNFILVKRKN